MAITKNDIEHLAKLARIGLDEDEKDSMTKELDSILGYVGQINEVSGEIKGERPKLKNVMREDIVTHAREEYTEKLLGNAPQREGNYVKVKKIL